MSDAAKRNAAAAALTLVRDGMTLGIGTGSTANHFVRMLGARVKAGMKIIGVPTSEATRRLGEEVGVPMIDLDHATKIDLAIDGADEIDPALNLIKGGGAAHTREKIVAAAADRFVVIADESKLVGTLGAFPLPIEVIPFGFTHAARRIYEALRATGCKGVEVVQRLRDGEPLITDSGNIILDAHALAIPDPAALADKLKRIPGVVEHGLFLSMTRLALIGTERGVETREV